MRARRPGNLSLGGGVLPSEIMLSAGDAAVVGGFFVLFFKLWRSRQPLSPTRKLEAAS
jgi:MFS transporter, AAHS family, 4-hydroxybenzoate transporter